jgi:hypothetical protein
VLRILVRAESVMFMAIAVALVVIAVVVFTRGGHDLVLAPRGQQFAVTITRAVDSALFIVVVLKLEGGGFQLRPFLVIGIISATRDILTVGAELSLVGELCHSSVNLRRWYAGSPGWTGPERAPVRNSVTLVPASHLRRSDRRSSSTRPPHTP